jgi:predicted ATPase
MWQTNPWHSKKQASHPIINNCTEYYEQASLIDSSSPQKKFLKSEREPIISMELDGNIPLVGRDEELQVMLDLRRRISEEDGSVGTLTVLVHGCSGSGKTALCHQVLQQQHSSNNTNKKVYSIAGKFDQYQKNFAAPYSALVQAFDSLGQQILESANGYQDDDDYDDKSEEFVAKLKQCLSKEACLLVQLIPSFQEFMRTTTDNGNQVGKRDSLLSVPPMAPDYKATLYGTTSRVKRLIDSDSDESDEEDYFSTFSPLMIPAELQPTLSSSPKQNHPRRPSNETNHNNHRSSLLSLAQTPSTRLKPQTSSLLVPPPRLSGQQSYMTLASERLAVAFRLFLAEFCSNQQPLILLVDDLQWADVSSITLLAMLAKNVCGITNMMMVLCFRDKDDDNNDDHEKIHSQDQDIPQLIKSKINTNINDNISDVQVGNLTLRGVQEMLAKILRHDLDDTKLLELAVIVHRKTHGNPYFVQEFLKLLAREEILTYNFATISWQWHATVVQETDVSDNVVSVVLKRMESLPASVRRLLTLASFVGYYASTNLLMKLTSLPSLVVEHAGTPRVPMDDNTISRETKRCDDDGMLLAAEKEGFVEFIDGGTTLVFSHDRVQQAAYASAINRDLLHWNIGQVVYESFVKGGKAKQAYGDRFVFVAVDQLNRGSSCITTEEQRLEIMRLNLYASQLAGNKSSSIVLRGDFLQKAIALSKETDWIGDDETYQMVLEIYSKSMEVEYSRGNLTTSQGLASTVLQRARKPEDARGAKTAKSHAYGWSMQWREAIQEAREVLDLCGVTLAPSNPRDVEKEYQKLKRLVKGMSDDDLLNLPAMTDELKISAMKILKLAVPIGFSSDVHYANLCLMKMMELTIRYGHFVETGGFALSGFGRVLVNLGKNEKQQAYRFAQLSLKVAADRVSIPGTALNVYGYLSHIQQPTGGSLEPTLAAYRAGLEVGDMTFGGICVALYVRFELSQN